VLSCNFGFVFVSTATMRSIKLYGWEPAFIQRVLRIRNDQELRMLRKIGVTIVCDIQQITVWSKLFIGIGF
jgi:16S rRNA U1498 N3-methylase RsmE